MINGLLTLRGAWDRVRTEPILKFFVAGLTFYGMATFEGPMLSIKSVSALAHYTDWIIAHVHAGTLGWNGFMTFGMLYYLVPKLWKTDLYSKKLADAHFWTGLVGTVVYVISMWTAGITQGLMLRAIDPSTHKLMYPDFIETVTKIVPLYAVRAAAGGLYLFGFVIMIYNLWKTVALAPKDQKEEIITAPRIASYSVAGEAPHRKLKGFR